jgi:lysophospholipase L1-like esterase
MSSKRRQFAILKVLVRELLILSFMLSLTSSRTFSAQQLKSLKIVTFGDSTTVGYSVTDNYPRQLDRRLEKLGTEATIINSGVNGDTTSGATKRFDEDVLAHNPDVVIIQFGLNDQTMRLYEDPSEMTSYVSLDDYAANLRRFVSELRSRNCWVILMTPNPMCWTGTLERHYPAGPFLDAPNGGNQLLEHYVETVREIARTEKIPLVDVFRHFNEYERKTGGKIQELFLDDGVHPNERGYSLIVDWLIPRLLRATTGGQVHGGDCITPGRQGILFVHRHFKL